MTNLSLQNLDDIAARAVDQIQQATELSTLEDLRVQYLGKKGELTAQLKQIGGLSPAEKPLFGDKVNQIKKHLAEAISAKKQELDLQRLAAAIAAETIDVSLPGRGGEIGGLHPVTRTMQRIEDIFTGMGFAIASGPEIEDDFHNFEALNIPDTHPARDMQDTFWFKDMKHLLRTHTSTIQVRGMESRKPPFKFVGPGKVFRCERTDATHEMCFHQLEGMMV